MNIFKLIVTSLTFVLLAACSNTPVQENVMDLPDWVISPPNSNSLGAYGVGIAESRIKSVAIKKSILNAQLDLAKTSTQTLSGGEAVKTNSAGGAVDYTLTINSKVKDISLNAYELINQKVKLTNGKFKVFSLIFVANKV